MEKLKVLDLFSGIGGFSLGLERTGGFSTVAFCEIEPFPRKVLAKHWPGVPIYEDVRTLTGDTLARDGIGVDVICGGFPCQDISLAGAGAGIDGARSGLWSEYARLIGELRPRFVIVENVAALLGRGLGRVLGDLAALGFDAEWHCIPASAVGAPHRRDRLWIMAHPNGSGRTAGEHATPSMGQGNSVAANGRHVAYPQCREGIERRDADVQRGWSGEAEQTGVGSGDVADANRPRLSLANGPDGEQGGGMLAASGWWAIESDVGRVAHGVPKRVDRLKALGNSVVPQVVTIIGRAILEAAA